MKQDIKSLLNTYQKTMKPLNPKTLKFIGVEGFDVYNPSAPFMYQGKELIIARVEKRDSEVSKAVYFEKTEDAYIKRVDLKTLDLQDPCVTSFKEEYVVGGTYVYHEDNKTFWFTRFYKGSDLNQLTHFVDAPMGMKDVRFQMLNDGRVAIFTRPQGIKGGRGKIGFTIADSVSSITTELIDQAPLFDQFIDSEWGGANHLTLLDEHTIGVLGHIANFSEGDIRHYYAMTFKVDILSKEASKMKIIAIRDDFNEGPAKRPDLVDVLFAAGIVEQNEKYVLYVGVSDAEVQTIEVVEPF